MVAHVVGEQDAYQAVRQLAALLGTTELQLKDYGATKSASFSIEGRAVELLHARDLTIETGLSLPEFPRTVAVSFAPEGLYDRAKLLETVDVRTRPVAGHEDFDRLYVVLGEHASVAIPRLAGALPAMVDAAQLRPDLNQLKLDPGEPPKLWLHLRTRTAIGPDPQSAIEAVRRTLDLAGALEKTWAAG